MTAFQRIGADTQRLDFLLLRDGSIVLYFNKVDLETTCEWFRGQAYCLYRFDCRKWGSATDFYDDFYGSTSNVREIADCGYSLDALRDCLAYLNVPLESGMVFVFEHFNCFTKPDPRYAHEVLDILAEISRFYLLFGQRLIVLLHSDDPKLTFSSVGASQILPARWKP